MPGNFAQIFPAPAAPGFGDEREDEEQLMGEPIGQRLQPGVKLAYEYDSGSTTDLSLRVLEERPGSRPKPKIRLLARNVPPDIRRAICRKPSTQFCTECEDTGADGALCDACAAKHECGEELRLPVLNTPRMGVRGSTGPSVET